MTGVGATSLQEGVLAIGEEFGAVLAAAQSGAPWAFERLYNDTAPQVANYLRLRGSAEPEDQTSEVFLAVFERLTGFTGGEREFRAWVFTIAHRRAADSHRRTSRRPWTEVDTEQAAHVAGGDVEDDAMEALGTAWVHHMLASLSPVHRDVLLLRVIAGLSIEQVAAALGKSGGAIKQHQRRALIALRERLEEQGITPVSESGVTP